METLARTTLDLPAPLLREIKSRAALSGMSMKAYLTQIMENALRTDAAPVLAKPSAQDQPDWMAHVGSLEGSPNFSGDPVDIQRKMRSEWQRKVR